MESGKKMQCKCKADVYEDLKELLRQANDTIEQFQWVDVNERLPDIGQSVLAYMQQTENSFSSIPVVSCTFTKYGFERACVTHWMLLPKPPTN
jgi:hypothetical protein